MSMSFTLHCICTKRICRIFTKATGWLWLNRDDGQKAWEWNVKKGWWAPLLLPTIPLIRNFYVKRNASARVSICYIGSCNVNSYVKTSRRKIENILNKSFDLVYWLNNKIFLLFFLKTNKRVCFGQVLSSPRKK